MSEPHTWNVNMSEPHSGNSSVNELHTRNCPKQVPIPEQAPTPQF